MTVIDERTAVSVSSTPRDRIVDAGYELFSSRGVRDVSIDEIVVASGVAKATLYRHFASKDDLVLAFLAERETRWTFGVVDAGIRARAEHPEARLVAIFDVFHEWFQRDDFEACSFVNVLLELGPEHPAGQASILHLAAIREVVQSYAAEAGLRDPEEFAYSWHILMKGSIVQAAEGDRLAARRAQGMARALIERHR